MKTHPTCYSVNSRPLTRRFPLLVVALLLGFISKAQDYSQTFGNIGWPERELTEYAPDKDAEAVVLFDIGRSYFVHTAGSYEIIYERTTRIKVLEESGIKWAEVEIPFYQHGDIYERVYDIQAVSYNYEEGRLNKTPLDVSNTYNEKVNESWNVKKFAVPNVRKGTILEYRYKISSPYKFNLRDWQFQWRIPVVHSQYEVSMIPFYKYAWLLQGATKFDSHISYVDRTSTRHFGSIEFNDLVNEYVMENVPAFKSEEFISSISDYIIKLDFQLSEVLGTDGSSRPVMTTWEDLIKELSRDKNFGRYVSRSGRQASKVVDIDAQLKKSERERYNFALDYVKRNYNWRNTYGKYATKSPKDFVEDKLGNSADINLFTIGLLQELGIEAYPILISTRGHGKIREQYPYLSFFNYVVVMAKVEGQTLLCDATEVLSLHDQLPVRCINGKGLIIQDDKVEWIALEENQPSEVKTDIHIVWQGEAATKARIVTSATDYDALYYRKYYTDRQDKLKEKLASEAYTLIDSTIAVNNQTEVEKPWELHYAFINQPMQVKEKFFLAPFFDQVMSDNPLKQQERTYPVDLVYPQKRSFTTIIEIPEGYRPDFIPEDLTMDNSLFAMEYKARVKDKQIQVTLNYHLKKSIYQPNNYARMKYYFSAIADKGNEKIVLTKAPAQGS